MLKKIVNIYAKMNGVAKQVPNYERNINEINKIK